VPKVIVVAAKDREGGMRMKIGIRIRIRTGFKTTKVTKTTKDHHTIFQDSFLFL